MRQTTDPCTCEVSPGKVLVGFEHEVPLTEVAAEVRALGIDIVSIGGLYFTADVEIGGMGRLERALMLPYVRPRGLTNLGGGRRVRIGVHLTDLSKSSLQKWERKQDELGLVLDPDYGNPSGWVAVPEGEEEAWAERLNEESWVEVAHHCIELFPE